MDYSKRPSLYIETSVYGFYYDETLRNRTKQEATRSLFSQIQKEFFLTFYSDITLAEIERTEDSIKRQRLLDMILDFELQKIAMPPAALLQPLTSLFLDRQIIPRDKRDDALHLALVILSPQIDYFITWNCRHLANINVVRRLKSAALSLGYEIKFEIVTPEEVIFYEEE